MRKKCRPSSRNPGPSSTSLQLTPSPCLTYQRVLALEPSTYLEKYSIIKKNQVKYVILAATKKLSAASAWITIIDRSF